MKNKNAIWWILGGSALIAGGSYAIWYFKFKDKGEETDSGKPTPTTTPAGQPSGTPPASNTNIPPAQTTLSPHETYLKAIDEASRYAVIGSYGIKNTFQQNFVGNFIRMFRNNSGYEIYLRNKSLRENKNLRDVIITEAIRMSGIT
jgi:hypothetical protein